eukprot:scaffold134395_cov20-Tisochrysis_lutea.AAC.1
MDFFEADGMFLTTEGACATAAVRCCKIMVYLLQMQLAHGTRRRARYPRLPVSGFSRTAHSIPAPF